MKQGESNQIASLSIPESTKLTAQRNNFIRRIQARGLKLLLLTLIILAFPVAWAIRSIRSPAIHSPSASPVQSRNTQPPVISSIQPANPLDIIGDQSLVVSGEHFQKGLEMSMTFPNGDSGKLCCDQIQYSSPTSFVILVDLNGNPGRYLIQAINPDGKSSASFTFLAEHKISDPVIESISPAAPPASKEEQSVSVYGHNFQVGLTVEVTFPNGESSVLRDRQIPNRTSNSFRMLIYFNGAPGKYTIHAINPSGRKSKPFSFMVGAL
jgi:hypothetical protein